MRVLFSVVGAGHNHSSQNKTKQIYTPENWVCVAEAGSERHSKTCLEVLGKKKKY